MTRKRTLLGRESKLKRRLGEGNDGRIGNDGRNRVGADGCRSLAGRYDEMSLSILHSAQIEIDVEQACGDVFPVLGEPEEDVLTLGNEMGVVVLCRRSGDGSGGCIGRKRVELKGLIGGTDGWDAEASRSADHGTEDDGDRGGRKSIVVLGHFDEEGKKVSTIKGTAISIDEGLDS